MSKDYLLTYSHASEALAIAQRVKPTMKYIVYVLRCRYDKYYVGITTNLPARIVQHFTGHGAKWTKAFVPIEINSLRQTDDPALETTITQQFIDLLGSDSVRGGPWCSDTPPPTRPRVGVFWDYDKRRFGIRLRSDKEMEMISDAASRLSPRPDVVVIGKKEHTSHVFRPIRLTP